MSPYKIIPHLALFICLLPCLKAETDEETFNRLKPEAVAYLKACALGNAQPNQILYTVYYINGNQAGTILNNAAERLEALTYQRLTELTGTINGNPTLIERVQYALQQNEKGAIQPAAHAALVERVEYTETTTRSLAWLALIHQLNTEQSQEHRMATTLRRVLQPTAQVLQPPENFQPPQPEWWLASPLYLYIQADPYTQLIHYLYFFFTQTPSQTYLIFFLLTYPHIDSSFL